MADVPARRITDSYVKLLFPVPGVDYPEPFDMRRIRAELPREHWPRMRTCTVRAYDEQASELTIDFVYHGDEGLAGPWAKHARPGDELWFAGPGVAYAPGDESALPAIGGAAADGSLVSYQRRPGVSPSVALGCWEPASGAHRRRSPCADSSLRALRSCRLGAAGRQCP